MTQDNKALQDLFDTVHYNEDLVDRSSDVDEIDPDDDEEYEATLDALCRIAEYNIENGHSWDYIVQFIIDFVRVVEVNDL